MSSNSSSNMPGESIEAKNESIRPIHLESNELETINKYAIDKLEKFEIFKNNPKFFARLKLVTDTDSFYEAQQMYKTIHFR